MSQRIPHEEAFEHYISLGHTRSYSKVAEHYGVSKRSIVKVAARHDWSQRLLEIESKVRERATHEIVENWASVTERHLKVLRTIQHRALQALQKLPLQTGMQAVRALDITLKQEQALLRPNRERGVGGYQPTLEDLVLACIKPTADPQEEDVPLLPYLPDARDNGQG
jgi:hypothetical protein